MMKTIVITGASSGIGNALLHAWIDRAHIIGVYHPKDSFAIEHPNLIKIPVDLSDPKSHETWTHALPEHVDIFVANAGYAAYEKNGFDRNAFERMMQTNAYAIIEQYQFAKSKYADIHFVVMLSAMAFWPLPGYAMYASTKAFLDGYFKAIRWEDNTNILRVYPVAVNTGFFETSHQPHKSWLIQDPHDVARKIIKAIRKNRRTLHTSRLFKWTHRIIPNALNFYLKREQKKYKEYFK